MKIILVAIVFFVSLNALTFNPLAGAPAMNVDPSVKDYKKTKEVFSYEEMISYMKLSGDKHKIMVLGVLYSKDSKDPDDLGVYIKADPILAKKYFIEAYDMGKKESLIILIGLILYNDNMATLDKDLSLSKKYMLQAVKDETEGAIFMLGTVELLRGEYKEGIQHTVEAAENGDPLAQLKAAIIFQKGIYSEESKTMVVESNYPLAGYFLNKACTNPIKEKEVTEFCSSDLILQKN